MTTTTTPTTNANALDVLRNFARITRPKFVGLTYQNEYEKAHVIVLVGVDLENVYRRDLKALREVERMEVDALRLQAIAEVIASVENSLEKGIGNNDAYTCADTYTHFGANMKMHKETGEFYVSGFVVRKTVLEVFAQRKAVKSSEKTLAKNAVKNKYTRMAKFRQYKVNSENMRSVSASGNRLVLA